MFAKVVLSLFVLIAAVSGNGIGSNKCTWGPSYWCSGANAANECGALAYCQSKGLLMDVAPVAPVAPAAPVSDAAVSPTECKLCQLVVGAVAKKVGSNATESEVEQVLDTICDKLGGFKGVCETFVTKYTPELIALLVDDLNASSVCIKLGLCPKADGSYATPIKTPVQCKLCQMVVNKVVANLTSNSTESEIEKELDKVCNHLGSLGALCADFVEKYTPELIQILATDLNATSVCIKIGMCPNSTAVALARVAKPSPGECKVCEYLVGMLDAKFNATSTTEEIEAALDKVCSKMGAFGKVCEDLVTKYTPELVAVLVEDMNATRVCKKIGACANATRTTPVDVNAPLTSLTDSSSIPLAIANTLALGGAIGTQACTQGPAYWCASKANAGQCNRLAYCQANVW